MLTFQGDSKYASHTSYTCKLNEGEFKACKFSNAINFRLYNNYNVYMMDIKLLTLCNYIYPSVRNNDLGMAKLMSLCLLMCYILIGRLLVVGVSISS